jgi:hypothetical protein
VIPSGPAEAPFLFNDEVYQTGFGSETATANLLAPRY